jgi:NCAIR mutase (PurE)-related protein
MTATLDEILRALSAGEIDIGAAKERLASWPVEDHKHARIDHHRALRQGVAEVIFGEGKTPEEIASIGERVAAEGPLLVTRADPEDFEALKARVPTARYEARARCILANDEDIKVIPGEVAVVSAGTSDAPVAEEALVCARYFGLNAWFEHDVGVAGVHRVLNIQDKIREADVVIVVAGMDGALASVVGGLAKGPVIAVPTSVGYGATFGGVSALLSMLVSCASGITVVNIDNGFGAARAARRILGHRQES